MSSSEVRRLEFIKLGENCQSSAGKKENCLIVSLLLIVSNIITILVKEIRHNLTR